jgi:hypothetical protein
MDLERFIRISDEEHVQQQWWRYLAELEDRGFRLTHLVLQGERYDERLNETLYESVRVLDWRTDELLGEYDTEQFSGLDYNRERWVDVNGAYDS